MEFKKCPFCGEEPEIIKTGGKVTTHVVACSGDCASGVNVGGSSEKEAMEIWNTRPVESDLLATLESLDSQILACGQITITDGSILHESLKLQIKKARGE